jgi:hypothetical protein
MKHEAEVHVPPDITMDEGDRLRELLVFAYRACGLGTCVLSVDEDRLVENATNDDEYYVMLVNILKLVLADMHYAAVLDAARSAIVDKLSSALARLERPDMHMLLDAPLDDEFLPFVPGLTTVQVNGFLPADYR